VQKEKPLFNNRFTSDATIDQNNVVLNDETTDIGHDRTEHVKNDETITIDNDRLENVKHNETITIDNDRTETVKHNESITIDNDRTELVKNDETVTVENDQHTFIKKNQYESVDGDKHNKVKGDRLEKITGSSHLKITGSQNEEITQSVSRDTQMSVQEKMGLKYAVDAGTEIHLKAGLSAVIEATASITLQVGESVININPAGVFIDGPIVLIKSGALAVPGTGSNPNSADSAEGANRAVANNNPNTEDIEYDGTVGGDNARHPLETEAAPPAIEGDASFDVFEWDTKELPEAEDAGKAQCLTGAASQANPFVQATPQNNADNATPIILADAGAYATVMSDAGTEGIDTNSSDITTDQLKQIFPDASDEELIETRDAFNESADKFDINTPLRKAHFFAQARQEVDSDITLAEGLNYSATALPNTFSAYRAKDNNGNTIIPYTPNDLAYQHGRSTQNNWTADQDGIANHAYANRLGNGNAASGDGSKYKGQGFIHLTGKESYEKVNDEIQDKYPDSGIDIVTNGDDIKTKKGAMVSAMAYWSDKNLNTIADQGSKGSDVDAVTAVVNLNTDSYSKRRDNFNTAKEVFDVVE
jgi:putative chitinase